MSCCHYAETFLFKSCNHVQQSSIIKHWHIRLVWLATHAQRHHGMQGVFVQQQFFLPPMLGVCVFNPYYVFPTCCAAFLCLFVRSWHFMEDIIQRPVCQSAEKAVFFFFFLSLHSKPCAEVKPAVSISKSCFFLSHYLPHSPKQCVSVWLDSCVGVWAKFQNFMPGYLSGVRNC